MQNVCAALSEHHLFTSMQVEAGLSLDAQRAAIFGEPLIWRPPLIGCLPTAFTATRTWDGCARLCTIGPMLCKVALFILPSALALPAGAKACSIRHIPWQQGAVWPTREVLAPLNVHIYVHIPAPFGAPLAEPAAHTPTPALSGRVAQTFEEPVAARARALSLREVTALGGTGTEVPTRWRARRDGNGIFFELIPLTPLRPQAAYFVLAETREGSERLGTEFHTGQQRDHSAPVWPGIQHAVYVPPWRSSAASGDCSFLLDHGPQAALTIYGATDEGAVRYAIWLAKHGEDLPYEDTPRAYLTPNQGTLTVEDLPKGVPRLRIGVRAVDAAGNMSPPSEVELSLPPGMP